MKSQWLRLAFVFLSPVMWACQSDRPLAPQQMPASDLASTDTSPGPLTLIDSVGRYTIDTRAGLVFQVNKANCDIVSLRYQDVELQDQSKFSHIASGLGTGTQVTATQSADSTIATVTCVTPTPGPVTPCTRLSIAGGLL